MSTLEEKRARIQRAFRSALEFLHQELLAERGELTERARAAMAEALDLTMRSCEYPVDAVAEVEATISIDDMSDEALVTWITADMRTEFRELLSGVPCP